MTTSRPGRASGQGRWVVTVCLLAVLSGAVDGAEAHHRLDDPLPLNLIMEWVGEYRVLLQVEPPDPEPGLLTKFVLSILPKSSALPPVREARLWIYRDSPQADAPIEVPLWLREDLPFYLLGRYHFPEEGIYRVEVDAPGLEGRLGGSLPVRAPAWWLPRSAAILGLLLVVGIGMLFRLRRPPG